MADAVGTYLSFFHCLKQCRLRLWRGAIDFVGEHDVGEQRTRLKDKRFGCPLEDTYPDKISRQQVGSELHAFPRAVDRRCECLGQAGLADTGYVFDQQMALGE